MPPFVHSERISVKKLGVTTLLSYRSRCAGGECGGIHGFGQEIVSVSVTEFVVLKICRGPGTRVPFRVILCPHTIVQRVAPLATLCVREGYNIYIDALS